MSLKYFLLPLEKNVLYSLFGSLTVVSNKIAASSLVMQSLMFLCECSRVYLETLTHKTKHFHHLL